MANKTLEVNDKEKYLIYDAINIKIAQIKRAINNENNEKIKDIHKEILKDYETLKNKI